MSGQLTKPDVTAKQRQIRRSNVRGKNGWKIEYPDPDDATDEEEFSVVNLYKNGGNDGEVNVLVHEGGVYTGYCYFDDESPVYEFHSVEELIDTLDEIIETE